MTNHCRPLPIVAGYYRSLPIRRSQWQPQRPRQTGRGAPG
jgi:hypothetical protein